MTHPKIPAWVEVAKGGGLCHRCGGSNAPALPLALDGFVAWFLDFANRHRECPKPIRLGLAITQLRRRAPK